MSLRSYRKSLEAPVGDAGDIAASYRRPSAAILVATASVTLSLFLLAAFIKYHRQWERQRRDAEQELQEMKSRLADLTAGRAASGTSAFATPGQTTPTPLPEPVSLSSRRHIPEAVETAPPAVPAKSAAPPRLETKAFTAIPAIGAVLPPPPPDERNVRVVAVKAEGGRFTIDAGRDDGFEPGERLRLSRNGGGIGEAEIETAYAGQSLCRLVEGGVLPEPGDRAIPLSPPAGAPR